MSEKCEMIPRAISISFSGDDILRVHFKNGEVRDFNVREQLIPRKCYSDLTNPSFFRKAHIDHGVIVWNEDIDLDPRWLYEESIPVK